jgi:SAM-dependent methyltransferase
MVPRRYSFHRYLASKQSVDDRALNADVWATLASQLARRQAAAEVAVVEIGAGVGTMLHRLLRQGVVWRGSYTGVDAAPTNIVRADRLLAGWARRHGWQHRRLASRHELNSPHGRLTARFIPVDYAPFARRATQRQAWDAVLAHAFLDLVPLDTAVPLLLSLLRPGGLFHFSLNFDGETILLPEIDRSLDREIIEAYHRTMDERTTKGLRSGDSRTGRHLLASLPSLGGTILAAGSSDWVVVPHGRGYPADEAYFLHFICHTIWAALRTGGEIDRRDLQQWIDRRHRQVERAELVYIAHQLDVVGTASRPPRPRRQLLAQAP